jgi:dTDP-4-amino-4,6-dideoxygalactose transaminase
MIAYRDKKVVGVFVRFRCAASVCERYHHDVVGVNSRLDSIQAAVLNAKLPLLDQYGKARQDAARKYSAALKEAKYNCTEHL